VLKGEIRHYDTKLKEWRPLQAGDVQIIRAGNGISHSEWLGKDGEIFQIWFDPNLNKTLSQPATYDDYKAAEFPEKMLGAARIKTLVGDGSPFRMDTPGVEVWSIDVAAGEVTLPLAAGKIGSAYILDGTASLNGEPVKTSDFVLLEGQESLEIKTTEGALVFLIVSPAQLDYPTYTQLARVH
jgi:hypothetical protein